MDGVASKILKRDAVGRVSYSLEQREALLDEFERSGLKGAAFARMTGLQYSTFAAWIQRRRHKRGDYRMRAAAREGAVAPGSGRAVRLVEAVMAGPVSPEADSGQTQTQGLRVELPGGARLLVSDERQAVLAARVIQTLAATAPC